MSDRMTEAYDDSNGAIEFLLPKLDLDWPPEPDTLFILMTRGERHVRESVNKAFGNIRSVVIDVDGEKHEYDADTLIALLEEFEVRDDSRTTELGSEREKALEKLVRDAYWLIARTVWTYVSQDKFVADWIERVSVLGIEVD